MDFALFILLNAVLLIRPAEVVPVLLGLPLYEGLILACLAVALPGVVRQLRPAALAVQPVAGSSDGLSGEGDRPESSPVRDRRAG